VSALARLQREFAAALFDESAVGRPGMEIYRGNVLANRRGALRATYPVVCRLVGDAFFDEAAARYAARAPSRSGDLHEYGDAFANFLEGYAHARSLPYLADVARLEWACHECYHAPDTAAFDFAALARVPSERHAGLRFLLHPAARLLRSAHPVVAIHAANQPGRDGAPGRSEGGDHALVRRLGLEVAVESIDPVEWEFLARLGEGATLGEACVTLDTGMAPPLARHVQSGVIAGIAPPLDPA
jgi:putative DNA-binding protein